MGLSTPEKTFKSSIKGIRNRIRKNTVAGVRNTGGVITYDEGHLRKMREVLDIESRCSNFGEIEDATSIRQPINDHFPRSNMKRKQHKTTRSGGDGDEKPHKPYFPKDESGETMGMISPVELFERSEGDSSSGRGNKEDDGEQPIPFSLDGIEGVMVVATPPPPLIIETPPTPPTLASKEKGKELLLPDDEHTVGSEEEAPLHSHSTFKKTIKRAYADNTKLMEPNMESTALALKDSTEGYSSGSYQSSRKRSKRACSNSQRLALLRRYFTLLACCTSTDQSNTD